MKNNKGFASTFILFGLLALFLLVISVLLFTMNNSSVLNSGMKGKLVNNIEQKEDKYVYKEYTITADINEGNGFGDNAGWTVSSDNKTATKSIEIYSDYGTLPIPYKTNRKFLGWYTKKTNGTKITSTTQMTKAANHTIYARWGSSDVKCKRATTLNSVICQQNNATYFCSGDGYQQGDTIYFGKLGSGDTIAPGDAFDCKIDNTGYTKRFYYISDYYDTSTKKFDKSYAVLIYSDIYASKYDEGEDEYYGPETAVNNLPSWSNVSLYTNIRAILTPSGSSQYSDGTTTASLPTTFSYGPKKSRLPTSQEIKAYCVDLNASTEYILKDCEFLYENTFWHNPDRPVRYWLETQSDSSITSAKSIVIGGYNNDTGSNRIANSPKKNTYGLKPVIEVSYNDILLTTYQ